MATFGSIGSVVVNVKFSVIAAIVHVVTWGSDRYQGGHLTTLATIILSVIIVTGFGYLLRITLRCLLDFGTKLVS